MTLRTRSRTAAGLSLLLALAAAWAEPAGALDPIKIGLVQGFTGPFEVYAKQEVTGFELGLEYATGGKKRAARAQDRGARARTTSSSRTWPSRRSPSSTPTTRSTSWWARPRARRARDAAGGGGVQEGPDRGAGGGRQHHGRELEPLHLPHRPQLHPGRDRQRARGGPARRSIATIAQDYAFGGRGGRLQGRGREAGAKVVHEEYAPRARHRLHRAIQKIIGALKDRRAPSTSRDLGRQGRAVPASSSTEPARQVRHHARRQQCARRAEGDEEQSSRAWWAAPTTTTRSPRTRSTTGWSPST